MREVLVSLRSGAAVVRDEDGSVLVTADVRGDDAWCVRNGDRFHPVKGPAARDGCVVGGLLPPGAVSVEAIDDRGDHVPAVVASGAYIAVLAQPDDGSEPIVCCRDDTGRPVRRPLPAEYPTAPVTDAQDPCPACGAIDYEEYRPFEAWRGGEVLADGGTVPSWVVCCRVCGHEEQEALVIRAPAGAGSTEERASRADLIARARAMRRDHMWRAVAPGALTQGFPIYVAEGWPARLSASGSEDDGRLTRVTVHHYRTADRHPSIGEPPQIAITTKRDDPRDSGPLNEARFALRGWVRSSAIQGRKPPGSHAARTLWLAARRRECNAAALNAIQSVHPITVDGFPIPALMLSAPSDRWVAVAVRNNLTIVVAGHGIEPGALQLSPIANPAESFGPRADD